MTAIREDMMTVERAIERIAHAGRATSHLLSYARAIEFLPLELTDEQRGHFENAAVEENRHFKERLDLLEPILVAEAGRASVRKVRATIATYEAEAQKVQRLSRTGRSDDGDAARGTGVDRGEESQILRRSFGSRDGALRFDEVAAARRRRYRHRGRARSGLLDRVRRRSPAA
jgi:methyl-accepting chemotaxis protein